MAKVCDVCEGRDYVDECAGCSVDVCLDCRNEDTGLCSECEQSEEGGDSDDEAGEKCEGCGFQEPRNYTFDCSRCGREICPECSDTQVNCRDCEMDIFAGDA